jgi:hypothetical protein
MADIYDMEGMTLMGSIGQAFPVDPATQGGGHIHLDVDSIKLDGSSAFLRADGLPEED